MHNDIILKVEKNVAHIVINRPDKRNALTLPLLTQLEKAFLNLNKQEDVLCVLLYGQGEESFCSGADLGELKKASTLDQRRTFFSALANVIIAMKRCNVPIITKVHGYAMAGGCGLAAAADIVLASDQANFGLPEVKIGLVPMVVLAALVQSVNKRALTHLILTGETISANEALMIGLVSKVYPKKDLDLNAAKICQNICKTSRKAQSSAKSVISKLDLRIIEQDLKELADQIAVFSTNDDTIEGIDAFLEKRSPKWPSLKNIKNIDKK